MFIMSIRSEIPCIYVYSSSASCNSVCVYVNNFLISYAFCLILPANHRSCYWLGFPILISLTFICLACYSLVLLICLSLSLASSHSFCLLPCEQLLVFLRNTLVSHGPSYNAPFLLITSPVCLVLHL